MIYRTWVKMFFKPEIILGPPGCGKTTHLLNEVQSTLDNGVTPNRIGYMAFTKKAATEAVERATERFNYTARQLTYFRTLHSMAFRILGLTKSKVLDSKKQKEFGNLMGITITGKINSEEGTVGTASRGDKALFISAMSRIRRVSLEDQYYVDPMDLNWYEVDRIHRGLDKFKKSRGVLDFTDMLEKFVATADTPDLDLLVVDEAQDLSALQWEMVRKMSKTAARTVLAGDDDQAIFQWAGADVEYFINLEGPTTVLQQSYRVPVKIQDIAQNIISRVSIRKNKNWKPREGVSSIQYHTTTDHINMEKGSWLVLGRNSYLLEEAETKCYRDGLVFVKNGRRSVSDKSIETIKVWEELRKGGSCTAVQATPILRFTTNRMKDYPHHGVFTLADLKRDWGVQSESLWHDAFIYMSAVERSYLIAALRRGEKLTKNPRIILSTIHGAKGGEADNVVLFTDIANRTHRDMLKDPDSEQRVFYVGATRAKENLHIILPRSKYYFSGV